MEDIYEFLEANQVEYERHDHEAVFTVEESKKLSPELEGASTKNLFLRDKKGSRHFLVTVPEDKQFELLVWTHKQWHPLPFLDLLEYVLYKPSGVDQF